MYFSIWNVAAEIYLPLSNIFYTVRTCCVTWSVVAAKQSGHLMTPSPSMRSATE